MIYPPEEPVGREKGGRTSHRRSQEREYEEVNNPPEESAVREKGGRTSHRRSEKREYEEVIIVEEEVVVDEEEEPPVIYEIRRFHTEAQRRKFTRSVLLTVALQLLVCAGLSAIFVFVAASGKEGREWISRHWWISLLALILWLIIVIAVMCCEVGRGPPNCFNVSLLVVTTLLLSIVCAFATAAYKLDVILYALGATVVVLLAITVITAFTKIDITGWGMYLFVALLGLMLASLIIILMLAVSDSSRSTTRVVLIVLISLMVVVLSLFILYDVQLIVGGRKRKFQLNEDDWLIACIILFTDIVQLFMCFLQLFGLVDGGGGD